ncbi:hypothetical protein G6M50_30910 [Agrobacterium rhizogenes]|nr:hypothetical protein [Rhizobium rhizogenes]NTJ82201.1 hypothetical protein [Rhizobium rhizogenes]
MGSSEDFMALLNAGKINEARALLDREKEASKFAPDSVKTGKSGEAEFYRGRRRVEQNAAGEWQLVPKRQ